MLHSPKKTSDTTVVLLHGAVEKHFHIPVLSGLGISVDVNANRLFISDPALTLSEDLLLARYAGNWSHPNLQTDLVEIIRKVMRDNGSTRVVFFGGSGGGFASMYLASHFDESLALVFNPQTDIAKYMKRAVEDFTHIAFQVPKAEKNPVKLLPAEVTTNLCAHYAKKRPAKIAYIQNLNDHTHVERHLRPFIEQMHPDTDVMVLSEPWNEGHTPPPKDVLRNILVTVTETTDPWQQSLEKLGFVRPHESAALTPTSKTQ